VLLAVIIFLTTVAAIMNFLDWKTDFLGINPPDKLHQPKVMHLEYPPASISGSIIINYPNNTVKGLPMVSVDVAIQYSGTLIEQTPVNIGANGYVYADGIGKIAGLNVPELNIDFDTVLILGFEGANFNDTNTNVQHLPFGQIYINLRNDENATKIHYSVPKSDQPLEVLQTLKWDVQGDYSPYTTILFSNGTSVTTLYPQYKIHVSGSEVVAQEHYSRVNFWLSVALFFFALVEAPRYLSPLLPRKWQEKLGINKKANANNNYANYKKSYSQFKPKISS
jgi:hypothetical protein